MRGSQKGKVAVELPLRHLAPVLLPLRLLVAQEEVEDVLAEHHAIDEVAQLAHHLVLMAHGRVTAAGPLADMLARLDLPVAFGDLGVKASEDRFTMLMGKGEAAARRAWLEEHGDQVEADI